MAGWYAYSGQKRHPRPIRCTGCGATTEYPGREGWVYRPRSGWTGGSGAWAERRCAACTVLPTGPTIQILLVQVARYPAHLTECPCCRARAPWLEEEPGATHCRACGGVHYLREGIDAQERFELLSGLVQSGMREG